MKQAEHILLFQRQDKDLKAPGEFDCLKDTTKVVHSVFMPDVLETSRRLICMSAPTHDSPRYRCGSRRMHLLQSEKSGVQKPEFTAHSGLIGVKSTGASAGALSASIMTTQNHGDRFYRNVTFDSGLASCVLSTALSGAIPGPGNQRASRRRHSVM